jgi:hypothetical protein
MVGRVVVVCCCGFWERRVGGGKSRDFLLPSFSSTQEAGELC